MWSPTHVKVVVQRAKSLPTKGKQGTNDCYVTIELGKDKYQTSIKQKSIDPEWHEECELSLFCEEESNLILTVLHRNGLGFEEFLGHVTLPLPELEFHETPRTKWYPLKSRKKKKENQYKGDLEVTLSFFRRNSNVTTSLLDLSAKKSKFKALKSMANSVGDKISKLSVHSFKPETKEPPSPSFRRSSLPRLPSSKSAQDISSHQKDNPPPRFTTVLEEEPETENCPDVVPTRQEETITKKSRQLSVPSEDWDQVINPVPRPRKLTSSRSEMCLRSQPELKKSRPSNTEFKIINNNKLSSSPSLPPELLENYNSLSHDELVKLTAFQALEIEATNNRIRDLENYLDNLLVRVMECSPKLLQSPITIPSPRIM